MKRIKEAAIKMKGGKVLVGRRHSNIIQDNLEYAPFKHSNSIQGFVTDEGEFVCRLCAAEIAIAAGQVDKKILRQGGILMSEDLY